MKAQVESSCVVEGKAAAFLVGGVRGGKVQKRAKAEEDVHASSAEVKAYLNKLQEIVPFMPKNKRLSKVEVISYVIDYIHDLRETLGLPPCTAVDQEDCEMGVTCDNKSTTMSSLCSSKVCDNSIPKKQDSESRAFSGEE